MSQEKGDARKEEKEKDNHLYPNHNQRHRRKISLYEQELIAYECVICKELPSAKIYQCQEGHLICDTCYNHPHFAVNRKCPVCNIGIEAPIRCRSTENTLRFRTVQCVNNECKVKLKHHELITHLANECEYAQSSCKYKTFGCRWDGIRKNKNEHEIQCKQTFDLNQILILHDNMMNDNEKVMNDNDKLQESNHYLSNLLFCFKAKHQYTFKQNEQRMNWNINIKFVNMGITGMLKLKYENVDDKMIMKSKLIFDDVTIDSPIYGMDQINGHIIIGSDPNVAGYCIFGSSKLNVRWSDNTNDYHTDWIVVATLNGSKLNKHYMACRNEEKYVLRLLVYT